MKKFMSFIFAFVAALTLVACGSNSNSNTESKATSTVEIEGFTYYGDIPTNPERVVSLSAYDTGYLAKLGLKLVGVTPLDKSNEALKNVTAEAKAVSSDDLEAIAELEPDVIVVLSSEENIDQLAEIAPVISIDYGTHDYLQLMTDFGQVFDKENEAQAWLDSWEEKTKEASTKISKTIDKAATFTIIQFFGGDLYLRGDNGGRGGEILYQALGFSAPNKVKEEVFEPGFLQVSTEVLGDYAGDYIIVSAPSSDTGSTLDDNSVWKSLDAVKAKHIITVDDNTFAYNDPISLEFELKVLTEQLTTLEK